jgi:hypothetical protein
VKVEFLEGVICRLVETHNTDLRITRSYRGSCAKQPSPSSGLRAGQGQGRPAAQGGGAGDWVAWGSIGGCRR